MNIHIFNPETDYALSCGSAHYNPPASVVRLRREMALFPATFAKPGEAILLLDNLSEEEISMAVHHEMAVEKGLSILRLDDCPRMFGVAGGNDLTILPWGWNHSLRRTLIAAKVPEKLLMSEREIDILRTLSHRHTTIPFRNMMARLLPNLILGQVKEIFDTGEALAFVKENGTSYFKAPWSSSGRGVVCSDNLGEEKLSQWIRGIIHRQGSVMAEKGCLRAADFATEWICRNGVAHFLGLSFFNTSADGRYKGNIYESQDAINTKIASISCEWKPDMIEAQKNALERIVAPHYDGPAGIDMLADIDGHINPCVEINLRMTMGLAALINTSATAIPWE